MPEEPLRDDETLRALTGLPLRRSRSEETLGSEGTLGSSGTVGSEEAVLMTDGNDQGRAAEGRAVEGRAVEGRGAFGGSAVGCMAPLRMQRSAMSDLALVFGTAADLS